MALGKFKLSLKDYEMVGPFLFQCLACTLNSYLLQILTCCNYCTLFITKDEMHVTIQINLKTYYYL